MAITFDAESAFTTASSTDTYTWSHTCSAGSKLFVTIGISQNRTITGVTYNGTAMTNAVSITNSGTAAYIFYLANPDSGAHNVVVTYSSAVANGACRAISFTGVSGIGATNTGSGTAQQKDISLTTTQTNSVIIDNHGVIDGTHTPISGQTRIANTIGASNRASAYEAVSTVDTYTQSWSSTTSNAYSVVALELKESTVVANTTNFFQFIN